FIYSKPAGRIRHHEIRRVQHKDPSAHVLMNGATQNHQARLIKHHRRYRPFLRTITAEIKSLYRRIGKDVVILVVEIWKLYLGALFNRQERWNKRQILLLDFFCWQRSWSRKIAVKIDHGQRRLRRKNSGLGYDLVPFCLNRRRTRFRKLHASLDS